MATAGTMTKFSAEETRYHGFTHRIKIKYTDLNTQTSGAAFAIFPLTGTTPAGTIVRMAAFNVITAFAGGSLSALVAVVGDGGSTNRYLASTDMFTINTFKAGNTTYAYTAADTIDVIFTATGDILANITAGEVDIYLAVADCNLLEN